MYKLRISHKWLNRSLKKNSNKINQSGRYYSTTDKLIDTILCFISAYFTDHL